MDPDACIAELVALVAELQHFKGADEDALPLVKSIIQTAIDLEGWLILKGYMPREGD